MYYLVLYFIICGFALVEVAVSDKWLKIFLQISVYFLLLLTSGFKYETGVDWRAYKEMITNISPINEISTPSAYNTVFTGLDVGFNLLLSVVKYFGGGIQTVFFILSFVSLTLLFSALNLYIRYSLLGVVLYYGLIFFYLDMSGIRQATTLCIFLYSVKYIQKRNLLKYSIFIFLAFTLHWSSMLLFPFYWLLKIKFKRGVVVSFLLFGMVIYFLKIKIITSIVPIVFSYVSNSQLSLKIFSYSTNEIFVAERAFSLRTLIHVITLVAVIFLGGRYKSYLQKQFTYYDLFYRLLVFQLLVYFVFYELPELAERVRMYFYCANIIVLPSLICKFKNYAYKFIAMVAIFCYSFFYCSAFLLEIPFTIAYHPYQNYIIYKIFDMRSTGDQRLEQHIYNVSSYFLK